MYLCTDSYNQEDLKFLNDKLKEVGFNNSVRKNNRLALDKLSSNNFLKWITIDNNIEIQQEYLHKWNIKNK